MANESLYSNFVSITPKDYTALDQDLLPPEAINDLVISQRADGRVITLKWSAPLYNAPSDPYLDDRYPEPEHPYYGNEPINTGTEEYPVYEYPLLYPDPLPLRDLAGFKIYRTTMEPEKWMGRPGNLNNLMNSFQNTKPDGYGNTIANRRLDPYHPPMFELIGFIVLDDNDPNVYYLNGGEFTGNKYELDSEGRYTYWDINIYHNVKYWYTITAIDKEKSINNYRLNAEGRPIHEVTAGTRLIEGDANTFRWPYR